MAAEHPIKSMFGMHIMKELYNDNHISEVNMKHHWMIL